MAIIGLMSFNYRLKQLIKCFKLNLPTSASEELTPKIDCIEYILKV